MIAVVLLYAAPVAAQSVDAHCPNYDGQIPPKLHVGEHSWMNFDGELSLDRLRGHAVWLEFSFIGCGGCQMMKPHLQGLQHRFGPEGLVVIEVNNGKIDTRESLAQEIARLQPNYPILWDEGGRTCDAYGISQYGTAYLVGGDGKVVWGGNPINLSVVDMWKLIHRALASVDTDALRGAGDPMLSRNPAHTGPVPSALAAAPQATAATRYDLGWDFVICTADNSMLIEGVRDGSPAQQARIQKGDSIVSINGKLLADMPFERLKEILHGMEASAAAVALGVKRGEEVRQITVAPAPLGRK
jgi:thiol-disulfide isomerase/thioredoxin